ncbi:MAG: 3-keto-disaccharide hydrolase, partial [Planctomycetota bacterium]
ERSIGGYMEVVKKTGDIRTKRAFGNCQLHIEWATPRKVSPKEIGQKRGNSGVFFMGKYELQILDSYENETYADGQAASIYGQYPPLVNACREPGQWQSYDVSFLRPIFNKKGKCIRPARITVFHNGVVVQNNVEIKGSTAHKKKAKYSPHADKLPLGLQDHNNPMRFRNIWIRELPEQPYLIKD